MSAMRTVALVMAVLSAGAVGAGYAAAPAPDPPRLLVFTKTTGHRHDSIPAAIQTVRTLAAQNGFEVEATEDAGQFTDAGLAPYDAVAFLLTSGAILEPEQRSAFERYIRAGHGYVGVHSAADTERGWPWYGSLVGAWSSGHPEIQNAVIDVASPRDASTTHLPARWPRQDEWYSFFTNPRSSVRVLLTLDESTYLPGEFAMGADHPIAWAHDFEGGRAWYTAGGHTEGSYSEPLFQQHLLGGIMYALTAPTPVVAKPVTVVPPKVVSVATALRGRRIAVAVRYTSCLRCSVRVRVRGKSIRLSGPARTVPAGTVRGTTAALPAGRWQLTIVASSAASGKTTAVRRWVRVR